MKIRRRYRRTRPLPRVSGGYGAIMADPPWKFRTWSRRGLDKSPDIHYPTMTLDAIKALRVEEVAAPDCALMMWVVDAHLLEALEIVEAWGFTYKTSGFLWVKTQDEPLHPGAEVQIARKMGQGYWNRKDAEATIFATRGRPPRLDAGVRQVVFSPRREHSRKPDEVRTRFERLVGGPYLEMFARETAPEWDSWGLEVNKFDR